MVCFADKLLLALPLSCLQKVMIVILMLILTILNETLFSLVYLARSGLVQELLLLRVFTVYFS